MTAVREAPTLADAQAAADALAKAGAAQVLVFGSVARGEATPYSDIDLVAVFDDLGDYSQRHDLKRTLREAAEGVANRSVDVTVTDRPEWRWRTESVSASFEAKIAAGARMLVDRSPVAEVHWDKEIGRPVSNLSEAQTRAHEAAVHLAGLLTDLRPTVDEIMGETLMRFARLRRICYASAMAVESLAKAHVALGGAHPTRTHQLSLLIDQLGDDPVARALDKLADRHGLSQAEVSAWRIKGTYVDDADKEHAEADHQAAALARLACDMGDLTAATISEAGGDCDELQAMLSKLRSALAATDIHTGKPLDT